MLLIRHFEETAEELFTNGKLSGTIHTCIGQEAAAVGVGEALHKNDLMTSTHRGHGHFLAKGAVPKRLMAEIFGKAAGYSGGRGGSQFMADYSLGFMGANGIVGGSLPVATGMALHLKMKKDSRIVACFLGDGAVAQGTFHESLNMAGLWKLPILFLCENNRYAMSTPCSAGLAEPDIAAKAAAYGMPGCRIDGNDLEEVVRTVRAAALRARRGGGPMLIELMTYRHSGHSRGDKRVYRTRAEENAERRNDPISRFRKRLIADGIMTRESDADLKKGVKHAIREAIRFAESAPFPAAHSLLEGVYA
jgi:TPP-dependent pyruvate/acetoin dehydrogenase alpha subunit